MELLKSGELDVWAYTEGESIDAPMKRIPPYKCGLLNLNFPNGGTKRPKEKDALATLAGTRLQYARFFPSGVKPKNAVVETLENPQGPTLAVERHTPAYGVVHLAWNNFPQEEKDLTQVHGGKDKIARMICGNQNRFTLSTIKRELRNLWSAIRRDKERLSKP